MKLKNKSLLLFCILLIFLSACGPSADRASMNNDTSSPLQDAASDASAGDAPDVINADDFTGEINTYELLDYTSLLIKYINQPVSSKSDIEQMDLLYFLIDCSFQAYCSGRDSRTQFCGDWEQDYEYSVGFDVLAEYMYHCFGVGADYLDRYKNAGDYEAQEGRPKYDRYDAENDAFKYTETSAGWRYDPYCTFSRTDTRIDIDDNKITVKTLLTTPDNEIKSADYTLTAHQQNGTIYYRLMSADIYEDERNKNENIILSLDGTDFAAPWYTVDRNGKMEYYTEVPYNESGWDSWDPSYEACVAISNKGIKNGIAYIGIDYYGICDTYVYDIENKTGRWMSGAEDLSVFYESELALLWEMRAEIKPEDSWGSPHYYRTYDIATISQQHDYALLRRSKRCGELEGEYLMRNLTTGEETFVCDSYARDMIISFMDESYRWVGGDRLMINVWLDEGSSTYDVVYDGQRWIVNKTDESMW